MPPEAEDTQDDLYRFWTLLKRFRRLITLLSVSAAVLSATYSVIVTPKYRAEVIVSSVQTTDGQGGLGALAGQLGGMASLVGLSLGGGAEKEQAIAVLTSRAFTAQMVDELDLMPVLFADDWDQTLQTWKSDDQDEHPTMADAQREFSRNIRRVREDAKTGLITLSMDWSDRRQAALWANLWIERLNDFMRTEAIKEANTNIAYLNEELSTSSSVELRQAISHLIEQQIEVAMMANTQKEFAFKVLDPAVIPDIDDYIWPMRAVIVIFGAVTGFLFGIFLSLLISAASPTQHMKSSVA
ncbi:MAG TPA: Wzz/FepE/Etk N-terminal domain-containing protein [Woeseiaceae bacterium]|nr:Wzz/FepE/Etk N-terminal domain-containing protein [Woeseiaceae bacterium]